MKEIGIYGGTFDPIHMGHLITAQFLLEEKKLDKIIFIPCYISPHKQEAETASPEQRVEMIKLAVEGNENFDFSEYEIMKKGVSYTIDTVRELKNHFPNLSLIIGYDNLVSFDIWYKPDEILENANLLVMKRVTDTDKNISHKYFNKATIVNTPMIEISSTNIRERIKQGLPIDYLVPEKVKEYIYNFELYK